MDTIVHQALVADIEAAIAAAKISKADFGRMAVKDPRLVYDLERGRELRMNTRQRVENAIADLRIATAATSGGAA